MSGRSRKGFRQFSDGSYSVESLKTTYLWRVWKALAVGGALKAPDIAKMCGIPRTKVYQVLKKLVGCGLFEKVPVEEIVYPEWYIWAGASGQRRWRVENGLSRGVPAGVWRRLV